LTTYVVECGQPASEVDFNDDRRRIEPGKRTAVEDGATERGSRQSKCVVVTPA
jgi:hypothetical protein